MPLPGIHDSWVVHSVTRIAGKQSIINELAKNFPAYVKSGNSSPCSKTPPLDTILRQISRVVFLKTSFVITHLFRDLLGDLFP